MSPSAAPITRLQVVTPPPGSTLEDASRAVAARNGGEIVRGWTEGIHVLRRRSAALDARGAVDRARRAQELADALGAVDHDLAAARRAREAADPSAADELRALAEAAVRAGDDVRHCRARLEELEAVCGPARDVAPARAREAASAAVAAHHRAAATADTAGARPPFEERLHAAATKAAWRRREAERVQRWSGRVTAGSALPALLLLVASPDRATPVGRLALSLAVLAGLAALSWLAGRHQHRQEGERLEQILFRSGVDSVAALDALAARHRAWEAHQSLVASAEAERKRTLAEWQVLAPGADLADAVDLLRRAGALDEASGALPRARRRLELAQRKVEVTAERWAAELAARSASGEPADIDRILAELARRGEGADPGPLAAERDRLVAELDAVLRGQPMEEVAAAGERAGAALAPLTLDSSHRALVVEVAHPAPSRRHEQEMLDEIGRLSTRVETVLVATPAVAANWGIGQGARAAPAGTVS